MNIIQASSQLLSEALEPKERLKVYQHLLKTGVKDVKAAADAVGKAMAHDKIDAAMAELEKKTRSLRATVNELKKIKQAIKGKK